MREITIPLVHPAYPHHFPGNPVVPGVVTLGCVARACAKLGFDIETIRRCKFRAQVRPGQVLALRITESSADEWRVSLIAAGETFFNASLTRRG
jgi:3-hydroxymyristoyl/3-hydroxydecanoyl-(acyl carrier protein) dehydratase